MATATCSNEAIYVSKLLLRLQEFVIDATIGKAVDTLLTCDVPTQDVEMEIVVAMKVAHAAINLKPRYAVASAKEDIPTHYLYCIGISLGGLAKDASVLIIILSCIF